ncbi:MAG: PAS domain S-box protein [Ignavibacteriales bacterium]|nr:MAG: PAS domain S-box protein [Ignavibacteriales bacterium]
MKLQVKAFIFMITLTGIFFIVFFTLTLVEKQKTEEILLERRNEKLQSFNRSLQSSSKALEIFSQDYSVWGDMVEFVKLKDKKWAKINIDESLVTFAANGAWVMDEQLNQIYSVNNLNLKSLESFPLSKSEVKVITDKNWISNFFIIINNDLFEIHYAPIQPSEDSERKTKPKGFFFVTRQWNDQILHELNQQSASIVELKKHTLNNDAESQHHNFRTIIIKPLNGFDGKPVMDIISVSDFRIMKKSSESYREQMIVLIVFSIIILLCTYVFLSRYIVRQLNIILGALEEQNPASLRTLAKKKDEFGKLSQLIMNFFSQKLQLMVEIQQRKDAETVIEKNEETYKLIFENIQDVYYKIDSEGTIILVSPSLERATGYKPEEILGKKVYEFCKNPELWCKAMRMLEKIERLDNFEFELITKSNGIILCSVDIHKLYDSSHKAVGFEGFIKDISKPKIENSQV